MVVTKVEFTGEVCDCEFAGHAICRTGIFDSHISSKHNKKLCVTIRMYVDDEHFEDIPQLETGLYKVTIEKI